MARPRATPEQRAEQRERLRSAARRLHREQGIRALSVRSVTEMAGVSSGTLYSYFDSLDELVRSLWLEPVERAGEELEAIAASVEDPVERIRALLRAYVAFARAQPELYRHAVMFVPPADAPATDLVPDASLAFPRLLIAALDEARERGRVETIDSARTAQVLWAGVHGAIALPINVRIYEIDQTDALTDEMIDRLVGSLTSE